MVPPMQPTICDYSTGQVLYHHASSNDSGRYVDEHDNFNGIKGPLGEVTWVWAASFAGVQIVHL